MRYLEIEAKIAGMAKNLDRRYIRAFWIAFALVNLAFLFYTVNFMFGDHDWNYVRGASAWNEGAFEGRPLHFVLQAVLFDGQVLPFLNSLFSFAALVLGYILLARYWQVPLTTFNYALFAVFAAVLPYTLVWLYYAKDMLINLSLPLVCVASLLAASAAVSSKRPWLHVPAMALMLFAFASYAAVINFYAVCLLGSAFFAYAAGKPFWTAVHEKTLPAPDILAALVLYKGMLAFSVLTSSYNTRIISWDYLPQKLLETCSAMFMQFVTPLPFMEYKYKLLLLAFCLLGLAAAVCRGGIRKIPGLLLLALGLLFASKLAFFVADERGQILAELENFAFVPRLDFYGLAGIYAFALACLLRFSSGKFRKAAVAFAVIIAFMSGVRDMYAQKVWKLGFDAEMKAHERIVARLERFPGFDARRKYRLLQIGSFSLRRNYYRRTAGEEISLDLLETSFTPEFMSRIVYNFYYPEDVFYDNAVPGELSKAGQDFVRNRAKPWPSADAVYIDGDIVVIVLTEEGLEKARSLLYF